MVWILVIIAILMFVYYMDNVDNKLDQIPREKGGDVLEKQAKIVSKRITARGQYYTETRNYVTFEIISSGERLEFETTGYRYGLVAEGDVGILHYQDKKFIDFIRI